MVAYPLLLSPLFHPVARRKRNRKRKRYRIMEGGRRETEKKRKKIIKN
jgi:hypothetical protein